MHFLERRHCCVPGHGVKTRPNASERYQDLRKTRPLQKDSVAFSCTWSARRSHLLGLVQRHRRCSGPSSSPSLPAKVEPHLCPTGFQHISAGTNRAFRGLEEPWLGTETLLTTSSSAAPESRSAHWQSWQRNALPRDLLPGVLLLSQSSSSVSVWDD